MSPSSNQSIRHRLMRFMALVAGMALLLMALGFLSYEYIALRSEILRNTRAQAEVVASSTDAALQFGSKVDAEKILASIAVDRQIRSACIYDQTGRLFASYPPDAQLTSLPSGPTPGTDHAFGAGRLDVSCPIVYDARPLGTVFIRTDLGEFRARLFLTTFVLAIMGLVIYGGVVLACASLQKQISDPILVLSETARTISQDKDYAIRLARTQGGEIGVLTDSLNDMLAQIQTRDAQLVDYKDHLEDQVAQRSHQLLRVNAQLVAEKERAEEASRTKSAFLANMSHELRTPLNAILLYSEILIDEVTERGAGVLTGDLNKIQTAGRHLLSLIDDILDLSKIEAGRMTLFVEDVDIPALLGGITTMLEPLMARNRNQFAILADPAIAMLQTDHKRLKQTLFNLLDNAAKFTKDGRITLTLRQDPQRTFVEFLVQDTGIGMSQAQVDRVFMEFTQADESTTRKYGGTGLGLTLSRKFSELLGGSIRVESEEGVGSTFILRLPWNLAEGQAPAAPPRLDPGLERGKVLIIDDDPSMREGIARLLAKEGFQAVAAAGGEEGLGLARTLKPDLITLDIAMPDMDGWEVLTTLKADPELAAIPVVLITMMDGQEQGFALGASDFLHKPVDREDLLRLLGKHVQGRASLPILVVEDNRDSRVGLERLLKAEGWDVRTAGDGLEAMTFLEGAQPSVMILDLMMPHMDGFRLVAEMQGRPDWCHIPIIILTARELTAADLERLQAPQVLRVMKKGAFSKESLMATVRELTLRCMGAPGVTIGKVPS